MPILTLFFVFLSFRQMLLLLMSVSMPAAAAVLVPFSYPYLLRRILNGAVNILIVGL